MQLTVALCTYNPSRQLLLRVLDAIVIAEVLAKTVAAFALRPWSTRYRIKYRILKAFARIRLEVQFGLYTFRDGSRLS